ncbi:non-hydrolyzing UDP-N-acetylglucosamine 2-epimerase [Marininema halotolerans]|uniref:UDP-GlcNAc3NAcA epimerase n=1 Tax=Marininema halotolerans TaxID=1155944 RepID=A0A1I6P1D5_9BACL|nr:UDP-N-acetylglucosamine 2-epimerase (non-hydrolyzing) [Marininema halotolerans]SFS33955.1 UDP-GlcNAc3NAcA epimerase [Marininema halotolerans]
MKTVTIVGARPQFIKAAPISRSLRKQSKEILVHSGQHYDQAMSDIFFKELDIPTPDYHLGVGSKGHGAQTGEILAQVEEVLFREKPDWVLVYGDTNTTLAGALAAAKLQIPVAHVEAGLRSFNRKMPEEVNRVLTDHMSTLLFCPTDTSVHHLATEGITQGVMQVGDVMVDAIRYNRLIAGESSQILERIGLEKGSYVLITLHRAENTDDPKRLSAIVRALNQLSVPSVLPLHPRTRGRMKEHGLTFNNPNLLVIEPIGYLDMLYLESQALKILTDSGGVQKEAFILEVPCITMRDETEWTETIEQGANCLTGADEWRIIDSIEGFSADFTHVPPVFGDGYATDRIVDHLLNYMKVT